MQAEIAHCLTEQETLELDVLVHGEAERNDMIEYCGDQLDGYAFSQFGWVQSYGSRLNWSFVRDDQPRSVSCYQRALAMRAEVLNLERAGNPDCGLKTRGWKEMLPALANMVAAARTLRGDAQV